jgi:hypothetical protein
MKIQISKEKTILIISILFALMVAFNIYYFSIKKAIDASYQKTYNKGIEYGKSQIYSQIVMELFSTGGLKINLPATGDNYDINGTGTKQIILIPKQ